MKFCPLTNWRKGQIVVLIDGEKYYTLDAVTNWYLNNEGEKHADLAAHRGTGWLNNKTKKEGRNGDPRDKHRKGRGHQ